MSLGDDERSCEQCGCTEERACWYESPVGNVCGWSAIDGLCTSCATKHKHEFEAIPEAGVWGPGLADTCVACWQRRAATVHDDVLVMEEADVPMDAAAAAGLKAALELKYQGAANAYRPWIES